MNKILFCISTGLLLIAINHAGVAAVLPEAAEGIKIPLTKKPTTRPMGVAYMPDYKRYYIADGGLAAMDDGLSVPMSKSEIHVFDENGKYLQSARPGFDNRSIFFNPNSRHIEVATYNISTDAGFSPNTGIFGLVMDENGNLTSQSTDVCSFNPAFGDAATAPSHDPVDDRYFAKQERTNKVFIVKKDKREKVGEIALDLDAAKVRFDDISDHFIAWTGIPGEELATLDIDHKAILVFNKEGKFVGRSALPADIKLRAQNHYNGVGYTKGMMFIYSETEGEFGTFRSFRFSDQAQ